MLRVETQVAGSVNLAFKVGAGSALRTLVGSTPEGCSR
jgi:hypothetical protein